MDGILNKEGINPAYSDRADFYAQLYDDAWRSEDSDGTTLSEVPADYFDIQDHDLNAEQNNDPLSFAITEVSLDFLSGSRAAVTLQRVVDSDDSQASSDSGIKTAPISKGSYAKYPETTAGLSDNDWNPYGTESDSNTTPRLATSAGAIKQTSLGGSSHLSFTSPLSSTKYNNPQPDPGWDMSDISEGTETNTHYTLKPCLSLDSSLASDVNEGLNLKKDLPARIAPEELNKTFRNDKLENKTHSNFTTSRHCNDFLQIGDFSLTGTFQANKNMVRMKDPRNEASAAIDYDLLQRDLQEIQDSLQRTLGPETELAINKPQNSLPNKDSPRSSESDIIPSTTTTPEKLKSKSLWGIDPRVILDNKGGSALKEVALRKPTNGYSSDGDEAHTSASSDDRIEEHAPTDVLKIKNADLLLTDFNNHKSLVQSNHRHLNSQGLAEKVLRILASEDPDHQVTEMLSEISLSERELNTRYALGLQNISSFSHDIDSGGIFDMANVRKKLELSDLSSCKVSFSEPSFKGCSAVDDKVQPFPDRMLTHSGNIRIPRQVIECYPVMGDHHPERSAESTDTKSQTTGSLQNDRENELQALGTSARLQDNAEPILSVDKPDVSAPGPRSVSSDEQSSIVKPHENSPVSSDSDISSSRWKEKYRPYKPPGSSQVYYTESDAVSIADSVTTVESSHLGSDDARGPFLPNSVLGSRADPPSSVGIYGTRKSIENIGSSQALASIPEKPSTDEQESEAGRVPTLETNSSLNGPQNPPESAINSKVSKGSSTEKHGEVSRYNKTPEILAESQNFPQETKSDGNGEFTENKNLNQTSGHTRNKRHETLDRQKENINTNWQGINHRNLDYIQSSDVLRHRSEDEIDSRQRDRLNLRGELQQAALSSVPDSSTRNVYISQAFHRALSPDILESIGHRSPLLGRTIEQSLAQPPAPNRRSHRRLSPENTKRTSGSAPAPPTFLARDRGYYEMSGRDEGNGDKRRFIKREARGKPGTSGEYDSKRKDWNESSRDPVEEAFGQNVQVVHSPINGDGFTEAARPISSLTTTNAEMQRRSLERADQHDSRLKDTKKTFAGRNVEITLEDMSTDSQDTELDHEPVSQRAKLLTSALTREADPGIPQDINQLWEQFLAANQSLESSLSSSRVEGVAGLLRNPAQHLIAHYMREREEYRIQRLERSELEMEKKRKELEKLRHKHLKAGSDNVSSENEKEVPLSTQRTQSRNKDQTAISLFSIMEDASFEQSPGKSGSPSKLKIPRQQHLIDPQMKKLRERIINQRKKAEKEAAKEQHRMAKLKKLEHLLMAKKQGKISDKTFERHLDDISLSTSSVDKSSDMFNSTASDNSQDSKKWTDSQDTTPLSNESTTAKDSSTDMHTRKTEKLQRLRLDKSKKSKIKLKSEDKGRSLKRCHYDQLKLFQLVRDGYLTPSEAYKLSLQKDVSSEQDISTTDSHCSERSSSDRSFSFARPHKLYSPYVRNSDEIYPKHPVPKLKLTAGLDDQRSQHQTKYKASKRSEKVKNPALYTRKHVVSKAGKTSEPADDESSRSVLSDDVSSFHNEEQSQDASHHLLSFLQKSSNMPPAKKQTNRQDYQIPYKENQNLHYRKKKGLKLRDKNMSSENAQPVISPKKGIAWDIPLISERPSRPITITQPLKERPFISNTSNTDSRKASLAQNCKIKNDLNIWNTNDHPEGIPRKLWEKVLQCDPLASKINHWDVDPLTDRVQYILDRQIGEDGLEDKPLGKTGQELSLQESCLTRKQDFISKCRERQKRIALASQNRHLQECLRLEREALFGEQEHVAPSNLFAHPYSDNLFQPKRRAITKQEMKDLTLKRYKKLPEVLQKQAQTKRIEEIKINRLRLKIFSRKVQNDAKRKNSKRSHS